MQPDKIELKFHITMFVDCIQVRSGLQRLSQRIIGSNTVVQGAIPTILNATPPEFFKETVKHVQVC
jgi:hypothetical protein